MINSIVHNEINFWNSEIEKLDSPNEKIYELAYFKIFVKFEVLVSELFINYSIGHDSPLVLNYTPSRILNFTDKKHLAGILSTSNSNYIDYFNKAITSSKYIFRDNQDPFSLVFNSSSYSTYYSQMKDIRNYIAHESNEAKKKYHKNVIHLHNDFIEPSHYLAKKNRGQSKTNYSIFIEKITEMTEILLNPIDYLENTEETTDLAAATCE